MTSPASRPPNPSWPVGYPVEPGGPRCDPPRGGYGTQAVSEWAAGVAADERPIVDCTAPRYMWRLSVVGDNIQCRLVYGTKGTTVLAGLRAPLLAFVPGTFCLYASPLVPGVAARVVPTLTCATGGLGVVRSVFAGPATPLPASVSRVTALTAATVTVAGVAVALAAGADLDVVAPSVVTAGTVIGDHLL